MAKHCGSLQPSVSPNNSGLTLEEVRREFTRMIGGLTESQLAAINITSPMVSNGGGSFTYTDETGQATTFTLGSGSTTNVLAGTGTSLTSTVSGVASTLNIEPLVDASTTDLVKSLAYEGSTGIWTITKNNGDTSIVSSPIDRVLDSSDFDPATNILTLEMTDGSSLAVDLADLVDAYVLASSDTTTVSGDGSTATPWRVGVRIDPAAGNLITASPAGITVSSSSLAALTTNTLALAGNVLTSTVNGEVATSDAVSTNTLLLGAAPGTIESTVNGVASGDLDLGPVVRPLADVEVQDFFGVTQYYAFSTDT
jgi:trimeric autotransporter adhesin